MVTYKMIGIADENGRTYESKYGTYNKKDGFKFKNPPKEECQWTAFIDLLFHEDIWKLKEKPAKKMSLADIEKELGYKVQIVDSKPRDGELNEQNIGDFLNWLFGITNESED